MKIRRDPLFPAWWSITKIANNNGTGIWCDGCDGTGTKTIRYNYIHKQWPGRSPEESAGIHFEISKNALIYNNLLVENERRGIYISGRTAPKSITTRSCVRGVTRRSMWMACHGRAHTRDQQSGLTNNIIYNNSSTIATSDLFIRQNDGNDIVGNVSDYNLHLSLDGGDPVDAAFHAGIGGAIQRWRRDKNRPR